VLGVAWRKGESVSRFDRQLWNDRRLGSELDVVGLGENSLDHLCVVERWPEAGEKSDLVQFASRPGGQVATALLGCARLGLRVGYVGAVGGDAAAESVLEPLVRAGVDLEGVRRIPGAQTRSATILVRRRDGERTVLAYRDPRLRLAPSRLEVREIERARALHVDASDPDASLWAARTARAADIPVVLDADHVWPWAERLLALTDFPVVSRRFAEEWGGTGQLADGLARLTASGARLAVATCGDEGAMARSTDFQIHSPAFAIEAADTTGAGDAFHAGFIWALLKGASARETLRLSNAVAGLACMALGAQEGLPRIEDLECFLSTHADTLAAGGPIQ
jgi:sulfofructose kinase